MANQIQGRSAATNQIAGRSAPANKIAGRSAAANRTTGFAGKTYRTGLRQSGSTEDRLITHIIPRALPPRYNSVELGK